MSRIAYINGAYRPHAHASVHIEDRGYQFADSVYEVCEIRDDCLIDMTRHLDRLERSLSELSMAWPIDRPAMSHVIAETVRRNRVRDGMVYIQVTRGVARRDHIFPPAGTPSSLVVTARATSRNAADEKAERGVGAITVPDNRWDRVDIKTTGLLPNAMAREQARGAGAYEAIFIDTDGNVTEGGATNVWIVDKTGKLVTRPAEKGILNGITRAGVAETAQALTMTVEERAFSRDEMLAAREVFITAATTLVMPVVQIDGHAIANGHPGHVAAQLRMAFHQQAELTPVRHRVALV